MSGDYREREREKEITDKEMPAISSCGHDSQIGSFEYEFFYTKRRKKKSFRLKTICFSFGNSQSTRILWWLYFYYVLSYQIKDELYNTKNMQGAEVHAVRFHAFTVLRLLNLFVDTIQMSSNS